MIRSYLFFFALNLRQDPFPGNNIFYIDVKLGNQHKKILFRITKLDISHDSINSFTLIISDGRNHESYLFLAGYTNNYFLEEFESTFLSSTI